MSELPVQKKALLGALALSTLIVPIIFGAAAQNAADPIPWLRIAPDFPPDALAAGREGSVELEFTIAANGAVKDVIVVTSTAQEFEAPAVAALLRWRYVPTNLTCVGADCRPIENVQPVERPGMRTVIHYRLADRNAQAEAE
jgi:TonB family protein